MKKEMMQDTAMTPAINTLEYEMFLKQVSEALNMDVEDVANMMKQKELKEILANHPYPITQGKDGRWRTYVRKEDGGRKQIAKASQEKVHEFLYDYYRGEMLFSGDTLEKLFPKWIEYKRAHGAAPTYILRLEKDFKNHYSDIAKTPINKFTKMMLDEWACKKVKAANHKKKQYDDITTFMRQGLDWAVDNGLMPTNVFRQVKLDNKVMFDSERKKPSETQVFSKKEVLKIYECARRDFEKGRCTIHKLAPLAIMFMFHTGVRVGELCALRYEDIEGDVLNVQRMYRYETKEVVNHTKGRRVNREVPIITMAKELIEVAKQYQLDNGLDANGYIFSVNDDPLSYYSVKKLLVRYCEEIGTTNKSSHKIRKTFISTLIDNGININTICDIVGHNDERTTFKHYCYDRNNKQERLALIENALN